MQSLQQQRNLEGNRRPCTPSLRKKNISNYSWNVFVLVWIKQSATIKALELSTNGIRTCQINFLRHFLWSGMSHQDNVDTSEPVKNTKAMTGNHKRVKNQCAVNRRCLCDGFLNRFCEGVLFCWSPSDNKKSRVWKPRVAAWRIQICTVQTLRVFAAILNPRDSQTQIVFVLIQLEERPVPEAPGASAVLWKCKTKRANQIHKQCTEILISIVFSCLCVLSFPQGFYDLLLDADCSKPRTPICMECIRLGMVGCKLGIIPGTVVAHWKSCSGLDMDVRAKGWDFLPDQLTMLRERRLRCLKVLGSTTSSLKSLLCVVFQTDCLSFQHFVGV